MCQTVAVQSHPRVPGGRAPIGSCRHCNPQFGMLGGRCGAFRVWDAPGRRAPVSARGWRVPAWPYDGQPRASASLKPARFATQVDVHLADSWDGPPWALVSSEPVTRGAVACVACCLYDASARRQHCPPRHDLGALRGYLNNTSDKDMRCVRIRPCFICQPVENCPWFSLSTACRPPSGRAINFPRPASVRGPRRYNLFTCRKFLRLKLVYELYAGGTQGCGALLRLNRFRKEAPPWRAKTYRPIRVSPFLEFWASSTRENLGGKRVAEKPYSVDP